MFYDFGPFRVDTAERQLWQDGVRHSLGPKVFDLLIVFLENPGKLLRKRELVDRVWSQAFVEDSNVAQHVAILRKALGDVSEDHQFIVTVPKEGYRFVCPVVASTAAPESPPPAPNHAKPRKLAAAVAACVLLGVLSVRFLTNSDTSRAPVPVTSLPGLELFPSISPDGLRVTFAGLDPSGTASHIYVNDLAGDKLPKLLTPLEFSDTCPAWSPDNNTIAFLRHPGPNAEVRIIPAQGGASRQIGVTSGMVLAWWPDSKSVIIADPASTGQPFALFRVDIATGARTKITSPTAGIGDIAAAVSFDARSLAFVRWSSESGYQILVRPLDADTPRVVVRDAKPIYGLAWSPTDRDLIYSTSRDSKPKLWRIAADASPATDPQRIPNIEGAALTPAVARRNGRLVYTQFQEDVSIRRWNFPLQGPPVQIAQSTRIDLDPAISPDGESIALSSDRGGAYEIWVCDKNGAGLHQVTHFHLGTAGSPRWSADGRRIVFDYSLSGKNAIYVVNADGSGLTEVPTGTRSASRPSWSIDGRSIYFRCSLPDSSQICKVGAAGGPVLQLTKNGGAEAYESRDGKTVFFVKSVDQPGLWRIPTEGGPESLVNEGVWQGYWGVGNEDIYFAAIRQASMAYSLSAIHLKDNQARSLLPLNTKLVPLTPGFSITPDGSTLLLLQVDRNEADIMMIDRIN
ncbi:MAG: PD40 domain-containing protein [Acidobacteria bacterium]|nr:PD40 domain-containing protein [Acidobacteriota bacterium]